jgi:serine/threonine protein phosphatase PrpC
MSFDAFAGLGLQVAEREIGRIVKNAGHRDDAAEEILDALDARGGSDNASVVVCDFTCPQGRGVPAIRLRGLLPGDATKAARHAMPTNWL